MKNATKLLSLVLTVLLLAGATSCVWERPVIDVVINGNSALTTPPEESETYKNFFRDDRIENQWENYGIGDPFIYRFDGIYYLICSTKAGCYGVKGWQSKDLLNWEPVDNGVSKRGYIVSDDVIESYDAYASEVYYLDGTFYLVESSNGKGHYVLASTSPDGPFEVISEGTIDNKIDGSLYMDTNGKMVLFTANGTVDAAYMADDMKSAGDKVALTNCNMNGWTEGPEILTRNGVRFYFYTGNGVTQRAYRINYSYGSAESSIFEDDIKIGKNVLLNTDGEWCGLGHGCVIMGPDLDSYYLGFHNIYTEGNNEGRRFNIGRLLFNGTDVVMQHTGLYDNIVPTLADYAEYDSENLAKVGGLLLSNEAHGDSFTVEFNFIGTGKLIFSYVDENNYGYVTFDGRTIEIHSVENGTDTLRGSCKTYRDYSTDVFHEIRIGYGDGLMDVSFDYQEIANDIKVGTFSGGKAGYSDSLEYRGSLIFNNTSHGDSDKEAVKMENIPATSYDKELSKLEESGVIASRETSANDIPEGTFDLQLGKAGDYATYLVNATESGTYGLDMVLSSRYYNRQIGIQVDGGTITTWTVPDYTSYAYDGYMRVKIADLLLEEGNHYITVRNIGDEFSFEMMYLERNYSTPDTVYEHDLKTYPEFGIGYPTFLDSTDEGLKTTNMARYLCTFGNGTLEDLEISCDIRMTGENGTGTLGIVVAADNWAFNNVDLDNYKSIQGEYFALNSTKITIIKSNYQYSDESCRDIMMFETDRTYNIKAVKVGKVFTMYVDGVKVLETFDPMGRTRGYCGLYSNFMEVIFSNLKIKTL